MSQGAKLSASFLMKAPYPPRGPTLSHTPWLWVYFPVRIVARDGLQSACVANPMKLNP